MPGVTWVEDPYKCANTADLLVILTEWNEFRGLDLPRLGQSMRATLMVDLRNIYRPDVVRSAGFEYVSVGRP